MADQKIGKILAVDDNEDVLFSLKLLLKHHVEQIRTESNPEIIPKLLKEENYDVILLDMNFTKDAISGQEGYYWLYKILEINPDAVVLFLTAYGDVEKSVKAIKAGATDFILKPWQNEKLLATVSSAIQLCCAQKEVSMLKAKQKEMSAVMDKPFNDFIGTSLKMQEVFTTITKVAQTDANVLILGENGTGKELVARALHRSSDRKDEVFISADLGSLNENIFESELFGHVKGAYTDAKNNRPGRFEIASGGTLFLDEIGNLSLSMQAKLLTVLERREVTRIGSNTPIPIDIRLICATNMPIKQWVAEDKYRQDLLYRINTVEINLPPLRERPEDIPLLTNHFLNIYAKKYKKNFNPISKACISKLYEYNWPGNIRELQHVIERAVIMAESSILDISDFRIDQNRESFAEALEESNNLEEVEKNIIQRVLRTNRGNISKTADELGLTRTSLYRRLEKYGL